MLKNPYWLDTANTQDLFYILSISGGRSSAYLLRHVLDAHDGVLPPNSEAIFCNTGHERDETLDFVRDLSEYWNCPITWIEYTIKDDREGYLKVNHDTASRKGEPFDLLLEKHLMPDIHRRTCTYTLKTDLLRRYVWREYKVTKRNVRHVVGIRYDEPRRWKRAIYDQCRVLYPMVHAHVTKEDIKKFWAHSDFDLGILSEKGNCDLCFLKGRSNLLATIAQEPHLADPWIAREDRMGRVFRDGMGRQESYQELRKAALFANQFSLFDDDSVADCFCGD